MEQWKMTILTGIILLILAILFAVIKGRINILNIVVIILALADIALGVYRKKLDK